MEVFCVLRLEMPQTQALAIADKACVVWCERLAQDLRVTFAGNGCGFVNGQ